jgi:Icc-related predicted phosphoesterase
VKLVLISDIHDRPVSMPKGDVLVLAGDIFCGDDGVSLRSDLAWIKSLGFQHAVLVEGNHDLVLKHLLKTQPETAWSLLKSAGVQLLIDESVEIDGLRFYGVGWGTSVPIPTSDVVISHCPAKGTLDQQHPPESEHLGSPVLAKQIETVKPRVFVCGHIHGGYGRAEHHGTTYVNCSQANEARETVNNPWVLEI